MIESRSDILIVGGSLSGLIHGVLLKREGHNIRILERNSASLVSSQGAGLNAGPDVQQFMQEFDRTGLPYSLSPPTAQITDCTGRVIKTIESDQRSTDWSTLYYRLRANFDGLRSDYCEAPPETDQEGYALYMDGHCVSGLKYEDGHLTILFNGPDGSIGSIDADLVIAADGPSSKIRQMMAPEIERRYVGYCGWRGTLPERELSEEAKSLFSESMIVCGIEKSFLTSYLIPGKNGNLEPGTRYYNWVWYRQYHAGSTELRDVMTDKDGKEHRSTVPIGKVRDGIMNQQRALARELLSPATAELVIKTKNAFIQTVSDVTSPRALFLDGRVLLVGDALATFRPMTGLGTNQAARQALSLFEVLAGRLSLERWERDALEYAQATRALGVARERLFDLA